MSLHSRRTCGTRQTAGTCNAGRSRAQSSGASCDVLRRVSTIVPLRWFGSRRQEQVGTGSVIGRGRALLAGFWLIFVSAGIRCENLKSYISTRHELAQVGLFKQQHVDLAREHKVKVVGLAVPQVLFIARIWVCTGFGLRLVTLMGLFSFHF